MSLIAPLRKDHPALSTRGLPAPVFPTATGRPRCPRCHKALATDPGLTTWACATCDYREPVSADAMATADIRRCLARINALHAPQGVEVPMVYTAEPFPEPDWSDDEPGLFPVRSLLAAPPPAASVPPHHERVGTYLLTTWCQRCQRPGRSYTACRCTLPPDRYVRTGDSHA